MGAQKIKSLRDVLCSTLENIPLDYYKVENVRVLDNNFKPSNNIIHVYTDGCYKKKHKNVVSYGCIIVIGLTAYKIGGRDWGFNALQYCNVYAELLGVTKVLSLLEIVLTCYKGGQIYTVNWHYDYEGIVECLKDNYITDNVMIINYKENILKSKLYSSIKFEYIGKKHGKLFNEAHSIANKLLE